MLTDEAVQVLWVAGVVWDGEAAVWDGHLALTEGQGEEAQLVQEATHSLQDISRLLRSSVIYDFRHRH